MNKMDEKVLPAVDGNEWPKMKVISGWSESLLLVEWPAGAELGPFAESDEGPVWKNRNFNVDLTKAGNGKGWSGPASATVNWGGSGAKNVEDTSLMARVLTVAAMVAKGWDDAGVVAVVPGMKAG